MMATLPDGCVDMVLCDLPYGDSQKSAGLRKLDRGNADRCDINLRSMVDEQCLIGSAVEHLRVLWDRADK